MRFPSWPSQGLQLRSPPTRSQVAKFTQQAINIWAKPRGLPTVTEDGVWGPLSDQAFSAVAYNMGLRYTRPMRASIRLVWHPWMRNPADRDREKLRALQKPSIFKQALIWEEHLAAIQFSAPGDMNPILQHWEVDEGVGAQPGAPWCQYLQNEAWHVVTGRHLPDWFLQGEPGYTPWVLDQARNGKGGLKTCPPEAGAWIYFSWSGGSSPDHVGMIVDVASQTTVEGNTSSAYGSHTVAYHHGGEHWPFACGFVWPWDMK